MGNGWEITGRTTCSHAQALMWLNDRQDSEISWTVEADFGDETVVVADMRGKLQHWRKSMPEGATFGRDSRREENAGVYSVAPGGALLLSGGDGFPFGFELHAVTGPAEEHVEELVVLLSETARIRIA